MGELLSINFVNLWFAQVLAINLAVAIAMIASLRLISGLVANVSTHEELSQKDNFAFGVAMAGGAIALAMMLTGVVSGEPANSLVSEFTVVVCYGLIGLVLIKVGRFLQDKLVLTAIPIQAEIKKGNMSAALVDVANTIATGLIIRAVMTWVESTTLLGLGIVIVAFILTQLVLALVTKYRLVVYAKRHDGACLQRAFEQGNLALSIRYLGHLIGVALAITAASAFVAYNPEALVTALISWVICAILLAIGLSILSIIARHIILAGINVVEEVDIQQNVAIGSIEASIYIAIGIVLMALLL